MDFEKQAKFGKFSPEMLVAATRKLIDINKGNADPDDRDSLANQTFLGPEDFFAERITKDSGGIGNKILWKSTGAGKLVGANSGALTPQLDSVLLSSGLGTPLEEINPIEILDQHNRVTRLGDGGIGSEQAIPQEAKNVQASQFGYIDPYRGPESSKIGVDTRLALGTFKGDDGNLYSNFVDISTGKVRKVSAAEAAKKVIAFPGELSRKTNTVRAMVRGKLGYVPKNEVDLELPHPSEMFSTTTNFVPLSSTAQGNRLFMAGKMMPQALPLVDAEAPLVQSAVSETGPSFVNAVGSKLGAISSDTGGIVKRVSEDKIIVETPEGELKEYEMYKDFPLNRKTFLSNTPLVKSGDVIKKGQVLARSNFTDDEGTASFGKNLRVAMFPMSGLTYEDAYAISESAAKKLSSQHMYTSSLDKNDKTSTKKNKFLSMFPGTYDKGQLKNIDENGYIIPGTKVDKGDPLILATGKADPRREGQWSSLSKRASREFRDKSEVWEHDFPAVVKDVVETPSGVKVSVAADVPMEEADKISASYGDKGVVAKIIPDAQMPQDEQGRPFEVIQNPLTLPTRMNPAQIYEMQLSKIARKTGKPVKVPQFMEGDVADWVEQQLRKHGLKDTETLYDPDRGRNIKEVLTGEKYFMKLHHTAESKQGARSMQGYTSEGTPSSGGKEGSKTIANLGLNSLLAHGAVDFIRDTKLYRSQRADDFWRAYKLGYTPPAMKDSTVYNKYLAYLRGAGVRVNETPTQVNIAAMTDEDVDKMSSGEITSADTVDAKDLSPKKGGLFDRSITGGHGGKKIAHITFPEPMPNPVMEEPIRRLLGLRKKDITEILAGKQDIFGKSGGAALKEALSRINPDKLIPAAEQDIKDKKGAGRDDAIKRLRYLKMLKENKIKPESLMVTRFPVIPPEYRPISKLDNDVQIASDANYLYQDLLLHKEALEDVREEFGDNRAGEEKVNMYKALQAVAGISDPIPQKLKDQKVAGLLTHVFGKGSPKVGLFQKRVIGMSTDLAGRGVITPNPKLDMDEVGLPETQAWKMYEPFVIRKLVRRGLPATEAIKMIEDKNPKAKRVLEEVMSERPLVITRAPVLSKYGMMGVKPRLTKGKTLEISPIVTGPFTADFDGNCCDFNTKINLTISKSEVNYTKEGREWFSTLNSIGGCDMLSGSNDVYVGKVMKIGEFPKIGSPVKDKNGADVYEVPKGVYITSYDYERNEVVHLPILRFTEEKNCPSVRVVIGKSKEVVVSDNESLAVFNPDKGMIEKIAPKDAVGSYVPVIRKEPIVGSSYNYDIGWWYGTLIADGWVSDGRIVGYAKLDDKCRERFVSVARDSINNNFTAHEYIQDKTDQKYSNAAKVHLSGRDLVASVLSIYSEGKGALHKTIPTELLNNGSRECLCGLFVGLIDGDCSLKWNTTLKNRRIAIRFNTSSPYLVKAYQVLFRKLGIRSSVTTTPARGNSAESYVVCPSVVDVYDFFKEIPYRPAHSQKLEVLNEFMSGSRPKETADFVVVESAFIPVLASELYNLGNKSLYSAVMRRKKTSAIPRESLLRALDLVKECKEDPLYAIVKARAECTDVYWEKVSEVTEVGERDVYDFEIPHTKVFALHNGIVVYDTMSYHVPVSDEAVKNVLDKMLPSKNLLSAQTFDAQYTPSQEYLYGLYQASRPKSRKKRHTFRSKEDAIRAYNKGEVGVNDEIVIYD